MVLTISFEVNLYVRFDSFEFQLKLRKFLNKSHIEVLEQVYTLQVTDNKRELIYDKNNKLIATNHYKISNTPTINSISCFNPLTL